MTGTVFAHAAPGGSQLPETGVLLAAGAAVVVGYLVGSRRLLPARASRQSQHWRSPQWWAWRSWGWRRYAFCAGVVVVVIALFPVIDPVADHSFPLHMVQHIVLMFVAAPLLALGAPGLPFLLALPTGWRRRVAAVRGSRPARRVRALAALPALAVTAYSVILVTWHLPAVYTAALESAPVHIAEHVWFLLAGWLLWTPLTTPSRQLDGGSAVLYLFVSGFPMIGVGAALTMAPRPLYPAQTGTGPGALAAQQLAGVLMWIPPTFVSLGLSAVFLLFWLRRMERAAPGDAPLPSPIPPTLPLPGPTGRLRSMSITGEVPR